MNTRGTPIRIGSRHLLDQGSNFHAHFRSACTSPPRNPAPIDPEAFSLPSDHRISLDHVQGLSPMEPDSREHDPKHAVFPAESRDCLLPSKHSQLLSQSQVFSGQIASLSKSHNNENC